MKIWLPAVRANSGGDVYVERLADLLLGVGYQVEISWFPLNREFTPWRLAAIKPPAGTDLIHAVSWNAFAFSRHPQPLVVTVHHCVRGLGFPKRKGPLQALYHNMWIGPFESRSFACADAIVGGSESAVQEVETEFDLAGRIEVIDHWLDTSMYKPRSDRPVPGRRVLWVGNMSKRKGADLLASFRRQLHPSIELNVLAGRRAQNAGLEALGQNVKVWPRLSEAEVIALYQSCDVIVSLSRHEGFGYTAVEAMACGKPVVAFDVTGLRDVVEHERTGILCPPEDVQAIAAACGQLVDSPELASRLGETGRARAVEKFGSARAAQAYKRLYEGLVYRKVDRA